VIVRTWSGKVPIDQADGFHRHLLATGVGDYRHRPGCADIALWRRDQDGWAVFTLVSTWRDLDSIRGYAGDDYERAVLYPDDDRYGLVPDLSALHHELLSIGH
jgi:quinol monooxygenase YgiN